MIQTLRLTDRTTQERLVVDLRTGDVLTDADHDGQVSRASPLDPPSAAKALEAAQQLNALFVEPHPGARTPDGRFESGGVVNAAERARLDQGESIPTSRTALQHHLDFFDRTHDGKISFGENLAAWQELGYGRAGAAVKAVASSLVFGRPSAGFSIDTEKLKKRYAGSTGVFDAQGNLDRDKLDTLLAAFHRGGNRGTLTQAEVTALLAEHSPRGKVSQGQFRSLFQVCERLNGKKVVTAEQLRAFFEGSLLYLAASATNHQGHRPLER